MSDELLELVGRIATALEGAIAISEKAPGWEYPMSAFPDFDWATLGIEPVNKELTKLRWMGHEYQRLETKGNITYQRPVSGLSSALLIGFYEEG